MVGGIRRSCCCPWRNRFKNVYFRRISALPLSHVLLVRFFECALNYSELSVFDGRFRRNTSSSFGYILPVCAQRSSSYLELSVFDGRSRRISALPLSHVLLVRFFGCALNYSELSVFDGRFRRNTSSSFGYILPVCAQRSSSYLELSVFDGRSRRISALRLNPPILGGRNLRK